MAGEPHQMIGRVAHIEARLDNLDEKQNALDKLLRSSVDDIKALIRAEVSDLKTEQITDLRRHVETLDARMDGQNIMISDVRTKQDRWDTSAGLVNWIIRAVIGVGTGLAGYFGAKHFG